MIKSIKSSLLHLAMFKKNKEENNDVYDHATGRKTPATQRLHQSDQLLHSTKALSIRMKAGLLTCNIFTVLPAFGSGYSWAKTFALLTVAGQLVIYTQFPINPGITRGPFPLDEEIIKELINRKYR
jgi:hypothetical protein